VIETIFKGNKYRFCKSDKGNYWIGISGRGGNLYPGQHCIAPVCLWSQLQETAIESGHSRSDFLTEKPEKKASVRGPRKSKKPSISIF